MNKLWKNLLKDTVFLALLVTTLFSINQILEPKKTYRNANWPSSASYEHFYEMKKNSIDVLFLGSSYAMNAFIPQELYDKYGITSYNLGSEQQSLFTSYYWLKEALQYQTPKAVVLEMRFAFPMHYDSNINTTEGLIRAAFDPMHFSKVKREAIKDIVSHDPQQSKLSYYLTNLRYHDRWEYLEDVDYTLNYDRQSELKGYAPQFDNQIGEYEPLVLSDSSAREPFSENMEEYLNRIADLCRKKNIQLILISIPARNATDGIHNTIQEYATAKNLPYYDLSEKSRYEQLGTQMPRESAVDHQNFGGAVKTTDYIGKILSETYGLSSHEDPQYAETGSFCQQMKADYELVQEQDPDAYIDHLNNPDYTVLIAADTDMVSVLNETRMNSLHSLGLQASYDGQYYRSYYAVLSNGAVIRESMEEGKITASGRTSDGRSLYQIMSAGRNAGGKASVAIDGTEFAIQESGLCIVVYDNLLHRVIDSVCMSPKDGFSFLRNNVSEIYR